MFKNQSISLFLLWAFGLLMVIFLCIPLVRDFPENKVTSATTLRDWEVNNTSEAYVFVTINKKHFLTRFVSYAPSEIQSQMMGVVSGRTVERVVTKIKPATIKGKVEDFTIKPAPLDESEINNIPK